jgi:hypothetical protein
VAVTLSARRRRQRRAVLVFGAITLVFVYTTVVNVIERPDGVKIASFFIGAIVFTSVLSRALRATELRATEIRMDAVARGFIADAARGTIQIIANEPDARDAAEYRAKELAEREVNGIAALLLHVRDTTGRRPHIYFNWTEGNPIAYLLRYLVFGDGEIAPLTREVLRQAEPDRDRRPLVHVG